VTATLGRFLILASVLVSTTGAMISFAAGRKHAPEGVRWAQRFAYFYAALMVLATLVMEYALLTHDFSVSYVAHVGSRSVPTWVTIVSLWSSLEGSILFWGAVLGIYIAVATYLNRDKHAEYMPYAIGTWLGCGAFFSFLLSGPANPFLSVPAAADGPGPNALLQNHLLMVVHPPRAAGVAIEEQGVAMGLTQLAQQAVQGQVVRVVEHLQSCLEIDGRQRPGEDRHVAHRVRAHDPAP